MYRIDNATSAVSIPTPAAVGPHVDGFFTKGDPTSSIDATIVDDDWLNAVQEELCNVITGAGITLSKTTRTQLLEAISLLVQSPPYGASSTAANDYLVTLAPAPVAYSNGRLFVVKFSNHNTSTATLNANSLGVKNIKKLDGSNLLPNDISDGMMGILLYDGTNLQLINPNSGNYVSNSQLQNNSRTYAASTTAANTYTANLDPAPAAYVAGMGCKIRFSNHNTSTTPTINLNGLGAVTMTKGNGAALVAGEISDGLIVELTHDGTNFQIKNPTLLSATSAINGLITLASNAEVLAGINTAKAITPAALASLLSLATPGYFKLPGGLIAQWGLSGNLTVGASSTITLPIAFPSVGLGLLTSPNVSSGTASGQSSGGTIASTSQISVSNCGTGIAFSIHWFAFGY